MKNLIILSVLAFMFSCGNDCSEKCTKPKESSKEIETLTLKLEASEAQILNLSAELSKCKGVDSIQIINN